MGSIVKTKRYSKSQRIFLALKQMHLYGLYPLLNLNEFIIKIATEIENKIWEMRNIWQQDLWHSLLSPAYGTVKLLNITMQL